MPDWRDEFLENIKEAEKANPVNGVLVATCSELQSRVVLLEAQLAATAPSPPSASPSESTPSDPKLALDLAEALRSKEQFSTRLRAAESEASSLRTRTSRDAAALAILKREKEKLERKVKDRDEELAQKRKHYEDIHDDQITLTLQLNMAEKERDAAKRENKQLVAELMRVKEREAEMMNAAMGERGRG